MQSSIARIDEQLVAIHGWSYTFLTPTQFVIALQLHSWNEFGTLPHRHGYSVGIFDTVPVSVQLGASIATDRVKDTTLVLPTLDVMSHH